MNLIVGVALVSAAVMLFILQPVVKGLHASLEREDDEMTDTEARKRVALLALRDVEYDFLAGKLDDDDYRSLKAQLTAEALAALEEDEAARSGATTAAGPQGLTSDEQLEAEIARVRRGLAEGVTCVACAFTNQGDARFCSSCGEPLATGVAS